MRRTTTLLAFFSAMLFTAIALLLFDPILLFREDTALASGQLQAEHDLAELRKHPVKFDNLRVLAKAVCVLEDQGFFNRSTVLPPVSPRGISRAVLLNVRGIKAGGSTIDQQLAKYYVLRLGDPTLEDKAVELAFATWFSRQATREEVLGLYLNLSLSAVIGERDPVGGLSKFVLAFTQNQTAVMTPDEQLLVAAVPFGFARMRREGQPAARLRAAHAALVASGDWPESARSTLDQTLALGTRDLYVLADSWQDLVATAKAGSTDYDLALAIPSFRSGLSEAVLDKFPDTRARLAFAAVRGNQALARSGVEAATMLVHYGSIAKLQLLADAVAALGPQAVHEFKVLPSECVRWPWRATAGRAPARWCPSDVDPPQSPMSLDEAVARSTNRGVATHGTLMPYRIFAANPDHPWIQGSRSIVPTESDRVLAKNLLAQVGQYGVAAELPPHLGYTAFETRWFQTLHEHREAAGLALDGLPLDVTQLVGNSGRDSIENVGKYAAKVLVEGDTCVLSDAGSLLAGWRHEGTLRWLASAEPDLVFSGKTGSSPHDDAAVAVAVFCIDQRPVVLAGALRAEGGVTLPQGLHGAMILRGFEAYLDELRALGRHVEGMAYSPAVMAMWAEERLSENTAAAAEELLASAAEEIQP